MPGFQRLLCHLRRFQRLTVSNPFWIWMIWLCLKIGYPQIQIFPTSILPGFLDVSTTHPCVKKLRHSASSWECPGRNMQATPQTEGEEAAGQNCRAIQNSPRLATWEEKHLIGTIMTYHHLSHFVIYDHMYTHHSIYNYISHVDTGHCISLFWRHPMNKH